jgi:serine/threonine protein kinase/pSer/pThr/pTyr-binding forkhead associated (FHA) protein
VQSDAWLLILPTGIVGLLLVLVVFLTIRMRYARAPRQTATPPPKQPISCSPPISPTCTLLGLTGKLQGENVRLGTNGLTIGRNSDNDIPLPDELLVSRFHAEIAWENDSFILRDLESTNGTWVDGQRIARHSLVSGNRIQIGTIEWLFTDSDNQLAAQPHSIESPSPQPPAVQVLTSRTFFDGFWLEEMVGRGGMSQVFRASAPDGRTVALKILDTTDPYLRQKFEAEGNKIGPLLQGHPHIVAIHGFRSTPNGQLYLVMDYVEGISLRRRLGKGDLSHEEIVSVLGQTCDALGFAHSANIVHRDVKPENILIQADGTVKVVDFGIARLTSAVTITQNKLVGTPEYMSPEQATGEPVRAASDVYSLGVVLYELLTHQVPFPLRGSIDDWQAAMQVVDQHIHQMPLPPHRLIPTVSADLEQVALTSLQKAADKRYRDGHGMGQALGYHQPPAEAVRVSNAPQTERHPLRRTPNTFDRPEASPPCARRLIVLEGPNTHRRWTVAEILVLGRGDLDPQDVRVSRRHIQLEAREDGCWLQDLSTNGTWVNHERVTDSVRLYPGDLIAVGKSMLQVQE